MFKWLIVLSCQYVIFGSVKSDIYKTFAQDKNVDDDGNLR